MKLLFVTQKMDRNDDVLGAYHAWITAFASQYESIEVICLYEGEHDLPANVRVHSLGKEKGVQPSFVYALRFLKLASQLRDSYDAAFVHMNQEYILIAGWLWKRWKKRIYMWRNHYAGSWLTDLAAAFCTNTFCTSKHSYTAKYRKNILMPVGIDTARFRIDERAHREERSVLFLARIAPSKRLDLLIEALGLVLAKGISFVASIYGAPLPADIAYYESLKARAEALGLKDRVQFHGSIPNEKSPDVYRAHEIFVNCSRSGMFDKTLFEAAACGCLVLAISDDFAAETSPECKFDPTPESLAARLEQLLTEPARDRETLKAQLHDAVTRHSLAQLSEDIRAAMEARG